MSAPKKKRGDWTEENLKLAIAAVQTQNLSQRAAATQFQIPRRTLRNHLKSGVTSKKIGKQSILSTTQEKELCERIKRFAEIGLPLTPRFIRKQAFLFCLRYDIPNHFNERKHLAGPDWLRGFLKRNPSISKRKPQIMNPARAQKMNKPIVQEHFKMVQELYNELEIPDHPERLYNMDEKGCRITVHHQNTVLAAKGSKRVHLIAPEHAENVTIAMCVNATGTTIPPMIIFKGQRYNPELTENLPAGTLVRMARKGSMTLDLFVEFIQHLGRHKVPGKCLLIFDGAKSHMSYEAVQEAEKLDIVLYCLPSNTTHELQPLDKSINKSFEHYWDEEVLRVLYNKPDTRLSKATFNKMFSNTWPKCMTHSNIVNGFKATGLFPFNPEAIPEEAYAPSILTEILLEPVEESEGSRNLSNNQNPTTSQQDDKTPDTLSQPQPNRFSASSLRKSINNSSLSYQPALVDYSLSSTDVSEDETEKGVHFPETENCTSPSILNLQDSDNEMMNESVDTVLQKPAEKDTETVRHVDETKNYCHDAIPSCSGLQKPVSNADTYTRTSIRYGSRKIKQYDDDDLNTDSSDLDTTKLTQKPSAEKCFALDLYSFSSDEDDVDDPINKNDITPKKTLNLAKEHDTKARQKTTYHSETSSTSDSEDDNMPLVEVRKQNSSFHKLMPTPNYAKTKSDQPRKKAINYKGVRVTKDLFKNDGGIQDKNDKKHDETASKKKTQESIKKSNSNKVQQMKTKEERACTKDRKGKNKVSTNEVKKTRARKGFEQETKASKKQYQDDKWYCYACFEEKFEDMRNCKLCGKWYHELCVGLTKDDPDFTCSNCDNSYT